MYSCLLSPHKMQIYILGELTSGTGVTAAQAISLSCDTEGTSVFVLCFFFGGKKCNTNRSLERMLDLSPFCCVGVDWKAVEDFVDMSDSLHEFAHPEGSAQPDDA